MKRAVEDDATLTGAALLWHPRNLVAFVFIYIILVLRRAGLTVAIRINAATVMNFPFHCWAAERLYYTRALLNFKDR